VQFYFEQETITETFVTVSKPLRSRKRWTAGTMLGVWSCSKCLAGGRLYQYPGGHKKGGGSGHCGRLDNFIVVGYNHIPTTPLLPRQPPRNTLAVILDICVWLSDMRTTFPTSSSHWLVLLFLAMKKGKHLNCIQKWHWRV